MRRTPIRREIVPGQTSQLDSILNRRRGVVETPAPKARPHAASRKVRGDNVVDIPDLEAQVLSDILDKARGESRPARGGDHLHVSDLLGKCIRKFALMERYGVPRPPQRLTLSDSLTFKQGDAIHDVIKDRAAMGSRSTVWGKWSCKCGTTKIDEPCTFDDVDHEQSCDACGGKINQYHEVSMFDNELGVVGNPDLLLWLRDIEAIYITELKSIANDQWVDLVRPKPDHVLQVTFYWYIMRKLGYRIARQVSILYVTKGYMFKGVPYKEFVFDAEEEVRRLEPYIEAALGYKAAKAGGELPARINCASPNAPDAKKCEVCLQCFNPTANAPVKVSVASVYRRTRG